MKFALIPFSLVLHAYMASGHAVSASHTLAVLQAYQAHLMRDLDDAAALDVEAVRELCRASDLLLRTT